MPVFVPEMGKRGIWVSVFNAISAFCNAGMDIIGNDSLAEYVTNPVINGTTCFLIIIGGVGYVVWWDVIHTLGNCIRKKSIKPFRQLSLHSKLALTTTTILLLLGTLLIFMLEYNNPDTLGCLSIPHKLQAAFFQSVTTRTAGFYTIDQSKLGNAASMVSLILMFIGGSPVGTAGGVKTVTVAVLFASAMNTFRNRNEIAIFNRRIDKDAIRKAVAVTGMSLIITFGATILLSAAQDADLLNILYETVSATATVGLSRNFTATLNLWGKLIIIVTMYLGRIGPISLAMAFILPKQNRNIVTNPTEEISVG
jgi:trk system potassium uptake protein TrkH